MVRPRKEFEVQSVPQYVILNARGSVRYAYSLEELELIIKLYDELNTEYAIYEFSKVV